MNVTITSLSGRAPPSEKRRRLLQNLVVAFQFDVFTLESLQLVAFGRRQAKALPGIAFRLTHPSAADLSDRANRHPTGGAGGRGRRPSERRVHVTQESTCWVWASEPSSIGMRPPTNPVRFNHASCGGDLHDVDGIRHNIWVVRLWPWVFLGYLPLQHTA